MLFFWNFLVWVEFERHSRVKFFSHFLDLSHPVLAKNNIGKRYLNFFTIFFGIFLAGSSMNGIRKSNFFPSFSAYPIPFWLKIMLERGFLIFSIFLLFFSEFSCLGRVRTEFGSKIFFSFSRPISSRFG